MKPIQKAFLADIIEHPDDDAPRLVYADWLDEYGDAGDRDRAEFIRLQIELSKSLVGDPWDPRPAESDRVRQLRERERFLLRRHIKAWKKEVTRRYGAAPEYRRGFLEHMEFGVGGYLSAGEAVHGATPLRSVRLSAGGFACGGVAALPRPWLLAALASPWSGRLTRLYLMGSENAPPVGPYADLVALAPLLTSLRELHLSETNETPASLRALARSPHLPGLRRLSLSLTLVGPHGAAALADSGLHLEDLDLGGGGAGDAGVAALAGGRLLGGLRRLDLRVCGVTDAGAVALARSPRCARLRSLDLGGNAITDRGLRAILESPYLTGLKSLVIDLAQANWPTRHEWARRFGLWAGCPINGVYDPRMLGLT